MRICGGCTACCTTLKIDALKKPAGMPCRYVGCSSCTNYDKRPNDCRDWQCQWMADNEHRPPLMRDGERPDMIGLLVNVDIVASFGTVLVVHELQEDAVEANADLIERLAGSCPVLIKPVNYGVAK